MHWRRHIYNKCGLPLGVRVPWNLSKLLWISPCRGSGLRLSLPALTCICDNLLLDTDRAAAELTGGAGGGWVGISGSHLTDLKNINQAGFVEQSTFDLQPDCKQAESAIWWRAGISRVWFAFPHGTSIFIRAFCSLATLVSAQQRAKNTQVGTYVRLSCSRRWLVAPQNTEMKASCLRIYEALGRFSHWDMAVCVSESPASENKKAKADIDVEFWRRSDGVPSKLQRWCEECARVSALTALFTCAPT